MSHHARTCSQLPVPYLPELYEILPGAKTLLACSCDNGNAEVGLVVEPIEYLAHFKVSFERYRVHLSFAVDCNEEDIVGWIREDDVGGGRWRCLAVDG